MADAESNQNDAAGTEPGAAEWERLLQWPQQASAPGALPNSHKLAGKRILITGAAGSIGSALAVAVQACEPESLVLLDHSETGLYELDRALFASGKRRHPLLVGSICDPHLLKQLFAVHRPQIVFHAAAYKHVPLMEQNPFAAIVNNALGSCTLAGTAAAYDCEQLVLVSTDKAADPVSIMGASKRIAELAWLSVGDPAARTIAVRLANVAGSRGSVLPLFLDQLRRGVPLSVTHKEARRYFMTMDEAIASLFAALEYPGSPALIVPELRPSIRILDLARHLLTVHQSALPVQFTGVRPGDKMAETLLGVDERWSSQPSAGGLRMLQDSRTDLATLDAGISSLEAAVLSGDLGRLLHEVRLLVPRYQPSSLLTAILDSAPAALTQHAQQPVHR